MTDLCRQNIRNNIPTSRLPLGILALITLIALTALGWLILPWWACIALVWVAGIVVICLFNYGAHCDDAEECDLPVVYPSAIARGCALANTLDLATAIASSEAEPVFPVFCACGAYVGLKLEMRSRLDWMCSKCEAELFGRISKRRSA